MRRNEICLHVARIVAKSCADELLDFAFVEINTGTEHDTKLGAMAQKTRIDLSR